jgi:hypothetical protein
MLLIEKYRDSFFSITATLTGEKGEKVNVFSDWVSKLK